MKLLAFIFEQPSYSISRFPDILRQVNSTLHSTSNRIIPEVRCQEETRVNAKLHL